MKILTLALVASLSTTAIGQEGRNETTHQETERTVHGSHNEKSEHLQLMPSTKMIGASIKGTGDEAVADVNSIVLSTDGTVQYILAGRGGVVGVGESCMVIPWDAMSCECVVENGEHKCCPTVKMDAEKAKSAPVVKTDGYKELYDQGWMTKNAVFYTGDKPEQTFKQDQLVCLDKVTDAEVMGTDRKSAGQLDDVIIDAEKGKAVYVILGRGGVAGIGEEYVAVPFQMLQFKMNGDETEVHIDCASNSLEDAVKVTPSEYPELRLTSVQANIEKSSRE